MTTSDVRSIIIYEEVREIPKPKKEMEMEEMKNIMKRAWEIARKGQSQFGGKVSEYLSEALKIAWAETKEVTIDTVKQDIQNVYGPGYAHRGVFTKLNEWKNYGKHRIYINVEDDKGRNLNTLYIDVKSKEVYSNGSRNATFRKHASDVANIIYKNIDLVIEAT